MKSTFSFHLIYALIIFALVLAVCTPMPEPVQSTLERNIGLEIPDEDLQTLVQGNNAFALDLYARLSSSEDNLFYSPYSISLALAMTSAGARNETGTQMAETLHFNLPAEQIHPAFNSLDLNLSSRSDIAEEKAQPFELEIANAIWAQQDHPFLPEYLDLLAVHYGAGIFPADFIKKAEAARIEINRWVSDQSNDRIKDLLAPGVLDTLTRMVLVNAIYFKADWQTPFEANDTYDAPFHLLDSSQVPVETMHSDLYLPYLRGENYQVIELPYVGGTAVMDVILPDEGQFATFESIFDTSNLNSIFEGMESLSIQLALPKFSFRNEFDLSGQLTAMGMPDAFDSSRADFSGMDGMLDLFISKVVHQSFVAVDEKGTEAAAATAVIMTLSAMPMEGIQLNIDRPFIFLIRDVPTGQILFLGRVVNPST